MCKAVKPKKEGTTFPLILQTTLQGLDHENLTVKMLFQKFYCIFSYIQILLNNEFHFYLSSASSC